jgi:hypothetical protein
MKCGDAAMKSRHCNIQRRTAGEMTKNNGAFKESSSKIAAASSEK